MPRPQPCLFAVVAATALASLVACGQAHATAFSSSELSYDNALLSQFNLVTLGNLTQTGATTSTIGGRVIVGGNATFTGSAAVCSSCTGNAAGSVDGTGAKFGALTVFGNLVTPGSNVSTAALSVGAGDASVRGTSSGNLLLNSNGGSSTGSFRLSGSAQNATNIGNATSITTTQSSFAGGSYTYNASLGLVTGVGATPKVSQTLASVFPFGTAYQTEAKSLSTGIAKLPGSPGVKTESLTVGNGIFFTAANDFSNAGKKYGVITTTVADLASETNFKGINNGTNDATFVIVTGDGANYTLPNLNSYAGSSKIIFDFVDATTLKFGGNWSGSILAPLATITSVGTIDGSVIVNAINQTQALYATNLFTGDLSGLVPEPSSLAVIGAGLTALGLLRRRRK